MEQFALLRKIILHSNLRLQRELKMDVTQTHLNSGSEVSRSDSRLFLCGRRAS